ncbi:MAG: alkanesulfonate monooxygenase SsuD [Planctomycetota bacterium]|jgi:alkanesulfonate monooxygenase SsuD/methylene tetrahydromethanopterin reductase-like flavin-dependent oxidoreductase (luciferase family)
MQFSIQLSAYYPDKSYGGDRVYADMLEQARCADHHGYESVGITEHHLLNILMMPAPLQFAVKIASQTQNVKIITAVSVLPLHDMRVLAGELVCADIFTDHRLMLGVGRGAFAYEMERMGVPIETSREKFDESLNVLQALLSEEEVSWDGKYYQFEPITIMPRPVMDIPIMMAVLVPEAIYHCAKRGFHIQTTPLSGDHQHMLDQVNAFTRGRDERREERKKEAKKDGERGTAADHQTLSLSRVTFLSNSDADRKRKIAMAHDYYSRFDNVFTGPGIVENGMIKAIPRKMTLEQTAENLTICTPAEMIDKLAPYAEAGVDRFIMNVNFGVEQNEVLESIACFAEEVMPHFSDKPITTASRAKQWQR